MESTPVARDDPLPGCYLLVVVSEPFSEDHKHKILQRVAKGLLSWDVAATGCDLSGVGNICTNVKNSEEQDNELLIQYSTETLAVEVLMSPQVSTLKQCLKNVLLATTGHKLLIHAGYAFTGSGSWILQNGTFSVSEFADAFHDPDVQKFLKGQPKCTVHVHCTEEGEWTGGNLKKQSFNSLANVVLNPADKADRLPGSEALLDCLGSVLNVPSLVDMMKTSPLVGNIRFNRPTLYVFPGGQGDCALFGISGFNMLVDGGFNRKPCSWEFIRHLDRLDAVLVTRLSESNLCGLSTMMKRKAVNNTSPQIGYVFCNIAEGKWSPGDEFQKDKGDLLISVVGEGHNFIQNLHSLKLKPHQCWRDNAMEPFVLYHKVGHGTLEMYVLSPPKDSKEMKEFLHEWSSHKEKFSCVKSGLKVLNHEMAIPLSHAMSICALLVWKPSDPKENITRILFPGSTPQARVLEGLEKLKNLDVLKHPTCTKASLMTAALIGKPKVERPPSKAPLTTRKNVPSPSLSTSSMTSRNGDVHITKKENKEVSTKPVIDRKTTPARVVPKSPPTKAQAEPKKPVAAKEQKAAPPAAKKETKPAGTTKQPEKPARKAAKPDQDAKSKGLKEVTNNKKVIESKTAARKTPEAPKPKASAKAAAAPKVDRTKPTPVPTKNAKAKAAAAAATAAVVAGSAADLMKVEKEKVNEEKKEEEKVEKEKVDEEKVKEKVDEEKVKEEEEVKQTEAKEVEEAKESAEVQEEVQKKEEEEKMGEKTEKTLEVAEVQKEEEAVEVVSQKKEEVVPQMADLQQEIKREEVREEKKMEEAQEQIKMEEAQEQVKMEEDAMLEEVQEEVKVDKVQVDTVNAEVTEKDAIEVEEEQVAAKRDVDEDVDVKKEAEEEIHVEDIRLEERPGGYDVEDVAVKEVRGGVFSEPVQLEERQVPVEEDIMTRSTYGMEDQPFEETVPGTIPPSDESPFAGGEDQMTASFYEPRDEEDNRGPSPAAEGVVLAFTPQLPKEEEGLVQENASLTATRDVLAGATMEGSFCEGLMPTSDFNANRNIDDSYGEDSAEEDLKEEKYETETTKDDLSDLISPYAATPELVGKEDRHSATDQHETASAAFGLETAHLVSERSEAAISPDLQAPLQPREEAFADDVMSTSVSILCDEDQEETAQPEEVGTNLTSDEKAGDDGKLSVQIPSRDTDDDEEDVMKSPTPHAVVDYEGQCEQEAVRNDESPPEFVQEPAEEPTFPAEDMRHNELSGQTDKGAHDEDEMVRYPTPPGEQHFYERVGTAGDSSDMADPITQHFVTNPLRQGPEVIDEPLYEESDEELSESPVEEQPVYGSILKADFPEFVNISGGTTPSEPQSPKSPRSRGNGLLKEGMTACSEEDEDQEKDNSQGVDYKHPVVEPRDHQPFEDTGSDLCTPPPPPVTDASSFATDATFADQPHSLDYSYESTGAVSPPRYEEKAPDCHQSETDVGGGYPFALPSYSGPEGAGDLHPKEEEDRYQERASSPDSEESLDDKDGSQGRDSDPEELAKPPGDDHHVPSNGYYIDSQFQKEQVGSSDNVHANGFNSTGDGQHYDTIPDPVDQTPFSSSYKTELFSKDYCGTINGQDFKDTEPWNGCSAQEYGSGITSKSGLSTLTPEEEDSAYKYESIMVNSSAKEESQDIFRSRLQTTLPPHDSDLSPSASYSPEEKDRYLEGKDLTMAEPPTGYDEGELIEGGMLPSRAHGDGYTDMKSLSPPVPRVPRGEDPYGVSSEEDDSSSLPDSVSPHAYTNKAYVQEDVHLYKHDGYDQHAARFPPEDSREVPVPRMTYSPGFPDIQGADSNYEFRLEDWGKPLGLPSPPPNPSDSQAGKKGGVSSSKGPSAARTAATKSGNKRPSLENVKNGTRSPMASPSKSAAKSRSAAGADSVAPVYVDLAYVPHHADPNYCNEEFFRRVRARYYVLSGTSPSKEVLNALLEAKKGWKEEMEVTIIPTYETDTLGYWMALNQDTLAEYMIDVAPSASRCTVNLQDHETSCAAYRLEF